VRPDNGEEKFMRIEKRRLGEGADRAAIVIPVKDIDDDITAKCLNHLGSSSDLAMDVFLVESTGDEFSFGKSINAGIMAAAPADVVICMDSDAYPDPGAISNLLGCMNDNPKLGFAAAKVRFRDQRPQIGWVHCGLFWFLVGCLKNASPMYAVRRLRMGKLWSFGVRSPRNYKKGKMVGATTTTFAIRRKCFDEVGPMDERFHVSFSDQDYCFRILTSESWYLTSCPKAVVFHDEHKTRKTPKEKHEFEDLRIYLEKWSRKDIERLLRAASEEKFIVPDDVSG
jgi:N-acetylglucosaminyl-diphospho-decaprenol L-rhamnosyltransferase